jgi:hypothetical protein
VFILFLSEKCILEKLSNYYKGANIMKDRALRRHQDVRAKRKSQKAYNSCIGELPQSERQDLENNIEKLRKVCTASHLEEESRKAVKKTVQEMKHDITMREELTLR